MFRYERANRPSWVDSQIGFEIFQVWQAGNTHILKSYERSILVEVDALLKSAIGLIRAGSGLPSPLLTLQVFRSQKGYQVELVFEDLAGKEPEDFAKAGLLPEFVSGLDEYTLGQTQPLYQNPNNVSNVKVIEATLGLPARLVVIKLYHCGYYNINLPIQEALLQRIAASTYVCKLLDVSLSKSSESLFQVGLVLERLDGDLQADVKRRLALQVPYTETELLNILGCVSDALLYAKLRVNVM